VNITQRLSATLHVKAWAPREWANRNLRVGGLVITLLVCLPLALVSAEWLQVNALLWQALFLGMLAGLLIAQTRWKITATLLAITVGGLLIVTQYYSRALPPLAPALHELAAGITWLAALLHRGVTILIWPGREHPSPAPPPMFPEWRAAGERLWLYGWNLQADWPLTLVTRHWESGQILLGTALGLLVWLVAALSVWLLLRRRSAWGALILVIVPLAYSVYRTWDGWAFLVIAVIAGALLAGDSSLRRLERRWGMGSSPYGLTLDWWIWAGVMTLVIAVLMGITIKLTDPEFHRWLHDMFSPAQTTQTQGSSNASHTSAEPRTGIWPRQHLLGSGPELAETPVMSVRTPGVPPAPFYWQAGSYDEYTGQGWVQNPAPPAQIEMRTLWPDSLNPPPHYALLRQSYRLEAPTRQIYAVGRPVRLTLPADGEWSDPWGADLIQVRAVTAQAAYEAVSWVPTATPDELRAASANYPDWAVDAYLALPEELPGRVGDLAQEVTADAPTVYDQALALQSYLRGYEYTLDLPAPPTDRDVVDYFLFDLQRGYCDYYATAMVVMARSLGIPARLAVGYATGEYDPELEAYQVVQANAHSWAEIYFPEYGWIRFEPTAVLPEAGGGYRLDEEGWLEDAPTAELFPLENVGIEADEAATSRLWPLLAVPGGLVGLAGLIGAALAYRGWRLRQGTPEQVAGRLYDRLLGWGRRLGLPLSATLTPNEFLSALQGELDIRAARAPAWSGDWRERRSRAEQTAGDLVALYAEGCYSPRQPTQEQIERVLAGWGRLNRALWGFQLAGSERVFGKRTGSNRRQYRTVG
jgi:transglutaminase-like putative cysteine protease